MSSPAVLEEAATLVGTKLRELNAAIDAACEAVSRRREEVVNELEPWLDKRGAAKYLAMAVSTLEGRMGSRNPPPHTNDGGKVRFKPSELDAWMRQWTVHYRRRL
jgi:hypothetical protein